MFANDAYRLELTAKGRRVDLNGGLALVVAPVGDRSR